MTGNVPNPTPDSPPPFPEDKGAGGLPINAVPTLPETYSNPDSPPPLPLFPEDDSRPDWYSNLDAGAQVQFDTIIRKIREINADTALEEKDKLAKQMAGRYVLDEFKKAHKLPDEEVHKLLASQAQQNPEVPARKPAAPPAGPPATPPSKPKPSKRLPDPDWKPPVYNTPSDSDRSGNAPGPAPVAPPRPEAPAPAGGALARYRQERQDLSDKIAAGNDPGTELDLDIATLTPAERDQLTAADFGALNPRRVLETPEEVVKTLSPDLQSEWAERRQTAVRYYRDDLSGEIQRSSHLSYGLIKEALNPAVFPHLSAPAQGTLKNMGLPVPTSPHENLPIPAGPIAPAASPGSPSPEPETTETYTAGERIVDNMPKRQLVKLFAELEGLSDDKRNELLAERFGAENVSDVSWALNDSRYLYDGTDLYRIEVKAQQFRNTCIQKIGGVLRKLDLRNRSTAAGEEAGESSEPEVVAADGSTPGTELVVAEAEHTPAIISGQWDFLKTLHRANVNDLLSKLRLDKLIYKKWEKKTRAERAIIIALGGISVLATVAGIITLARQGDVSAATGVAGGGGGGGGFDPNQVPSGGGGTSSSVEPTPTTPPTSSAEALPLPTTSSSEATVITPPSTGASAPPTTPDSLPPSPTDAPPSPGNTTPVEPPNTQIQPPAPNPNTPPANPADAAPATPNGAPPAPAPETVTVEPGQNLYEIGHNQGLTDTQIANGIDDGSIKVYKPDGTEVTNVNNIHPGDKVTFSVDTTPPAAQANPANTVAPADAVVMKPGEGTLSESVQDWLQQNGRGGTNLHDATQAVMDYNQSLGINLDWDTARQLNTANMGGTSVATLRGVPIHMPPQAIFEQLMAQINQAKELAENS